MAGENIQEGDIVQLKSGGPQMTVDNIYQGGKGQQRATCQWFEGTKSMHDSFPTSSLNKVG